MLPINTNAVPPLCLRIGVLTMTMFWKGARILSQMAMISMLTTYSLSGPVSAQFPPEPQGITYLQSRFHENVTISFKEVSLNPLVSLGLCEICF